MLIRANLLVKPIENAICNSAPKQQGFFVRTAYISKSIAGF